jgi:glycosyltransferase involved in cell wall biosynthesis
VSERRVAHVVSHFGELSETFIRDAVWELDRLGWEAWVISQTVANRDHFPFPPDDRLLQVTPPSLLRRVANRLGGRPGVERAVWLQPQLAAARPDVVHAHLGRAAVYASGPARRLGIPLLPSFHGYDLTVLPHEEPWATEYRRLFREVPRVTTVSEFLTRKLRELGYGGQVDIVPAGVRVDEIEFRGSRPDGEPRLLFVGRQLEYKGLDVLLRALPKVVAAEPDVHLDVVGDGPLGERNEALARDTGVARHVRFHGGLPSGRTLETMRAADILVVPSKSVASGQAEGSPVVTKEALAIGLQVVSTANGGLAETIPPQDRHELVPENDADALAEGIGALFAARDTWEGRARAGRAWVEAQFDWKRLARRIEAIYLELLDDERPPSARTGRTPASSAAAARGT